jgi:hypothetical protein
MRSWPKYFGSSAHSRLRPERTSGRLNYGASAKQIALETLVEQTTTFG